MSNTGLPIGENTYRLDGELHSISGFCQVISTHQNGETRNRAISTNQPRHRPPESPWCPTYYVVSAIHFLEPGLYYPLAKCRNNWHFLCLLLNDERYPHIVSWKASRIFHSSFPLSLNMSVSCHFWDHLAHIENSPPESVIVGVWFWSCHRYRLATRTECHVKLFLISPAKVQDLRNRNWLLVTTTESLVCRLLRFYCNLEFKALNQRLVDLDYQAECNWPYRHIVDVI